MKQILWKNIGSKEIKQLNNWLSEQDKHNLCMQEKIWEQIAADIDDCLRIMDNAQFKNIMGFVEGNAIVALMFGIEHIETLNLYNIAVNPKYRNMGIAKKVVLKLLNNDKSLNLTSKYKTVKASVLPDNAEALKLFKSLNFKNLGFDGEYVVFEKDIVKTAENVR